MWEGGGGQRGAGRKGVVCGAWSSGAGFRLSYRNRAPVGALPGSWCPATDLECKQRMEVGSRGGRLRS